MLSTTPCEVNLEQVTAHFPKELQGLKQWVLWRGADRVNKRTGEVRLTKIPINPQTLCEASPTDPTMWGTFAYCCAALPSALEGWEAEKPDASRGGGIGFVFTADDPHAGIDLDKCRNPETGVLDPWAQQLIAAFQTYTEVSPSGTGVKLWLRGKLSGAGRNTEHIEVYDRSRFFTATGEHLLGTPTNVAERQDNIEVLYAAIEVIAKALGDYGERFSLLFAGRWQETTNKDGSPFPNQSEADLALCSLAAQVGATAEQIDAFVRLSGLYRDKWDEQHGEQTYGQRTIAAVRNGQGRSHVGGELETLAERLVNEPRALKDQETVDQLIALSAEPLDRFALDTLLRQHSGSFPTSGLWRLVDSLALDRATATLLSVEDLLAEAEKPPTPRVIDGLLVTGGFSIVGAEPKCGKSTFSRNAIIAVLHGGKFLDRQAQQGPVLYYVIEEVLVEAAKHLRQLGLQRGDPLHTREGVISPLRFAALLRQDIERTGAIFAVIDPLFDVLNVQDINDYASVNRAMKPLVDIARRTGCHIVTLHHTNKVGVGGSAKNLLGSTQIRGATDCNITLYRVGEERRIKSEQRYADDRAIPVSKLIYDRETYGTGLPRPLACSDSIACSGPPGKNPQMDTSRERSFLSQYRVSHLTTGAAPPL